MSSKKGVLLVNLGTPEQPTIGAVWRYLHQFLSDKRVIPLPFLPWQILLNTIVLPARIFSVTKKYQAIWMNSDGAPLRFYTHQIASKLTDKLGLTVKVGMRYGSPSIEQALNEFREEKIEELIVLPLFPQYSSATTASVFDAVSAEFKSSLVLPSLHFIRDYHANEGYLEALAQRVQTHWSEKGRGQKLIIAFHGLPKRYSEQGDPYEKQCQVTASLLAKKLALQPDDWILCYQSRFGKAAWLQPYAASILAELPKKGVTAIDIISPGFAVECLETLEELCMQYRTLFYEAGGSKYEYVPALNESEAQINFLSQLITRYL